MVGSGQPSQSCAIHIADRTYTPDAARALVSTLIAFQTVKSRVTNSASIHKVTNTVAGDSLSTAIVLL